MNDNKEYSWINFKLDRRTHAQLSFILKCSQKHLKDIMTALVSKYIDDNKHLLSSLSSDKSLQED